MLFEMVGKDTEKLMIIFITIPLSTLKCILTFKKLASVHMGREKKENAIRIWCGGSSCVTYQHQLSQAITTDQMNNARLLISNFD